MGADLKVNPPVQRRRMRRAISGYSIDAQGGAFIINAVNPDALNVQVIDIDKKDRHILLDIDTDKWLCGHDERDWFVAAVPSQSITSVVQAKENLKPVAVKLAEKGLRKKEKNKRKNKARRRQGEWFFIPQPDLVIPKNAIIHKHEPISRSDGGKPHFVDEVYRVGGQSVWVSLNFLAGINDDAYNEIMKGSNEKLKKGFQPRTINAGVYGRGNVKHSDHATIYLDGWHLILMNTESGAKARKNLVFLD